MTIFFASFVVRFWKRQSLVTCAQGHTYCSACITTWRRRSNRCPGCRSDICLSIVNLPIRDMIMSLQVKCPEKRIKRTQAGGGNVKETCCEWTGTLSQYLEQHSKSQCPFKTVPCPFACGVKLPQGELEHHQESECIDRIVTCCLCKEEFPESLRFYHEDFKCLGKETECEYCGEKLLRRELGEMPFGNSSLFMSSAVNHRDCYSGHYRTCPKVNIHCDFHEHGCEMIILREDLSDHCASCAQTH
jgi:hypothetical protein